MIANVMDANHTLNIIYNLIVMYRFCLSIGEISLNLPKQRCQLRFMVRTSLQQPKCVEEVPLRKRPTKLVLHQDILFSIPAFSEQQQPAVGVYVIGISQQMVIHLGMFILRLSLDKDEEEEAVKIEGCIGQQGEVKYKVACIKESEEMQSVNFSIEAKSADRNYDLRQPENMSNANSQIQEEFDRLRRENITNEERRVIAEGRYEQLKEENTRVARKAKQFQELNKKLLEKYEELIAENIDLKSRMEDSRSRSQVAPVEIESYSKSSQTDNVHNTLEFKSKQMQTIPQLSPEPQPSAAPRHQQYSKECQTEAVPDQQYSHPQSQMFAMYQRQKIHNLEYLSRIHEMQIQQLGWQLQRDKNILSCYQHALKKHNIPVYRPAFKQQLNIQAMILNDKDTESSSSV